MNGGGAMNRSASGATDDLFCWSPPTAPTEPVYPETPGWRDPETSKEAAEAFSGRAAIIRSRVLVLLRETAEGLGVHQIASQLKLPISAVQPRVSELRRDCRIRPSGRRCKNESGMSAHIWVFWPEEPQ